MHVVNVKQFARCKMHLTITLKIEVNKSSQIERNKSIYHLRSVVYDTRFIYNKYQNMNNNRHKLEQYMHAYNKI